ncbi:hypothetical protein FQN54_007808 [Arachnomyces sp. PD_36]|nr:hypothetical protein FQN54_007808 [Arachnomyces sp. PD_36]
MSFRPMLQQRVVTPVAATLLAGGIVLYPRRTAYAEAPRGSSNRRPIYDDPLPPQNEPAPIQDAEPQQSQPLNTSSTSLSKPATIPSTINATSVSNALTSEVRQARLFLYAHCLAAENGINDLLSRILHIESAFTSTVASLAPSPESGERLLPGSIYVMVSAMAGSIVSRNRGLILRTASPLAFGTVAAWTLLPVTMRNVSDFAWEYEKKAPVIADQHLRIRAFAEESVKQTVDGGVFARAWMESKIGQGREAMEAWVSKGR